MRIKVGSATPRELQERARFDALRRRVFDEMGRGSARWRFTWILPVNVGVVGLLVLRGEPWSRALVQSAAVVLIAISLVLRTLSARVSVKAGSFLAGVVAYFVLLGTTGGLGSPLLMMGAIMLVTAAVAVRDPQWLRGVSFLAFLAGFVTLALLSNSMVGEFVAPLARIGPWPTGEYVGISLVATVFAMFGIYRMGCTVTRGYERAALELAERREELCSENEDRTRALEGMAARLAHEVKNPLAAIKGLSAHMARNSTDRKAAERLAIVAAEADRLQSIVEGFLSFSRGLDDLNLSQVRPFEVARELSVLLETRAEDAGIAFDVTGSDDIVLDADARKIRQALLNIVLNAIQASPRDAKVRIAVTREADAVLLTVRDDGAGMTPEVLERIRKPYFTTKEGGTGLGVAVARGLVEQHGGQMEFRSVPGRGTVVAMRLPAKAKPCARLPNPLRIRPSGNEGDSGEALERKPEPVVAGAR